MRNISSLDLPRNNIVNLDGLVKSLHPHNGLKTNGIQDESA